MRVGFIGLGSQGAPMARRIVEAGHPLTIWARRPETVESFADTAATVARTPAELAANSDVVCLCVVSDADVESVITRDDGVLAGLAAGGVIAIHATVHPDTCRRVAAHAVEVGVDVVDAPVSGGGMAAAEGKLLVMVGGDDAVVARVRPVFATYADPGAAPRAARERPDGQAAQQPALHRADHRRDRDLRVRSTTRDGPDRDGRGARQRQRRQPGCGHRCRVPHSTSRVCGRWRRHCSPRTSASCSTLHSARERRSPHTSSTWLAPRSRDSTDGD